MPQSIPYDPSLTLGNVVSNSKLKALIELSKLQQPIDELEYAMNSSIELLRSLDRTSAELTNLGIGNSSELDAARKTAEETVKKSAQEYATKRAENLPEIAKRRGALSAISTSVESPIDYNKTQIKKMPLSSDSLRMNAQYFASEQQKDGSNTGIKQAKAFVGAMTSFLGTGATFS
ncbi:MAG: hypothetical protein KA717_02000 [Woronichinia naegeliana WA131]|uniref:Uncharacterized protein n=1 Tax=Woronichinia naegeliana WA131 TaxID=2824559 RepID=A0A977PW60_9CYAN|nr:MAG: hypothetical protein KA717_02000 [Woronichinia naegeliana WA131]